MSMVADLTGFNVYYLVFYMVKICIDFFALVNYNLPMDYTYTK